MVLVYVERYTILTVWLKWLLSKDFIYKKLNYLCTTMSIIF